MPRIPCPECNAPIDTSTPDASGGFRCAGCGFSLTPVEDEVPGPASSAAAAPSPTDLPEEGEVLGELGRGGMGIVYKARHELTDEPAAVKTIVGVHASDPAYAKRFAREVKVL